MGTAGTRERILVADDEGAARTALRVLFTRQGYDVVLAEDGAAALDLLRDSAVDLVLTDLHMPRMDGLGLVAALRAQGRRTPCIVVTAFAEVANVVAAMSAGADDVLGKPYDTATLLFRVRKALDHARVVRDNEQFVARGLPTFVVGETAAMASLMRQAEAVARTGAPVLILGESGTGKELLARHVHALSPRASGPFVPVFCGALPESLVESELFGHEKGAFTGADAPHKGLVEEAAGGTLFLDEVGELPLAVQVKLLRLVQEGEYRPVGGAAVPRKADVRILAATNRDLEREVAAGGFREDLYFRLNVVPLRLPSVAERRQDVPLLVEHVRVAACREYGRRVQSFTPEALARLQARAWPGNVREIENVVRRLVIMCSGEHVGPDDLDQVLGAPGAEGGRSSAPDDPEAGGTLLPLGEARRLALEAFERRYLERAMGEAQGNVSHAARLAGKDRRDFQRLLRRHGLEPSSFRPGGAGE